LPDGQPDIQGVWGASPTGTFDLTDPKTGGGRIQELLDQAAGKAPKAKPSRVVDPPNGKIPYLPWAAAHQHETQANVDHPTKREHIDPQARCLPGAVPRSFFHSENMIVQTPGYVVMLTRNNHASRIIPLDGRPPLPGNIKLWMGDSRGRWEGNTLVVEVRNQNVKGRFDMVGNFATDNLYLVERWTSSTRTRWNTARRSTIPTPSRSPGRSPHAPSSNRPTMNHTATSCGKTPATRVNAAPNICCSTRCRRRHRSRNHNEDEAVRQPWARGPSRSGGAGDGPRRWIDDGQCAAEEPEGARRSAAWVDSYLAI
jgi:hypothetical protein